MYIYNYRKTLSEKQYGDYGSLYQCLQHMQSVYDAEPDNFPRYILHIIYV